MGWAYFLESGVQARQGSISHLQSEDVREMINDKMGSGDRKLKKKNKQGKFKDIMALITWEEMLTELVLASSQAPSYASLKLSPTRWRGWSVELLA